MIYLLEIEEVTDKLEALYLSVANQINAASNFIIKKPLTKLFVPESTIQGQEIK